MKKKKKKKKERNRQTNFPMQSFTIGRSRLVSFRRWISPSQQQQHTNTGLKVAFSILTQNCLARAQNTNNTTTARQIIRTPHRRALSYKHAMTHPIPNSLSLVESAKRQAAYRAVDEHFPRPSVEHLEQPLVIGIGSGSTVIYVIERILQLPASTRNKCIFVPTGYQSRQLILSGHLTLGDVDSHNDLLVAFDGADEVDPDLNCIKGGGACLFQEKLVAVKARKFVVVADYRKISESLSTRFTAGVPIEVVPPAVSYVTKRLVELGSVDPTLRMGGTAKAGPCVTDNGNFIIDAPFRDGAVLTNAGAQPAKGKGIGNPYIVEGLAKLIKSTVGVVEHGIFCKGNVKPVVAYFGMEDGTVTTRSECL